MHMEHVSGTKTPVWKNITVQPNITVAASPRENGALMGLGMELV